MNTPSHSFSVAKAPERPFIEPTFRKVLYESEKPTVLLISAVGATGKTTLAKVLSYQTGLPLLDLAVHKPVGDNTLTGLLANAYDVSDLSNVLQAIKTSTYGVVIDGIDEARSKTTEKAFEAFLDDIARLSNAKSSTSFVLLGRTQALEDCWVYLSDKKISTGLISIEPFSLEDARKYVDVFTKGLESTYKEQYVIARDYVLSCLSRAFLNKTETNGKDFLSFIGYPPVLEAIVTLLNEEKNYHRLVEKLKEQVGGDLEVSLLRRIAFYVLERERDLKVLPNIVAPLVSELPPQQQAEIKTTAFSVEEQCLRLVAYCLGTQVTLNQIGERIINEKYETQLATFLPEHPFLSHNHFRNAIFESLSLAVLMTFDHPRCPELVSQYVSSRKHNYHLIYLLNNLAASGRIHPRYMGIILGAALEFRSPTSTVELTVESTGNGDSVFDQAAVDIDIEIVFNNERSKSFLFHSELNRIDSIELGNRLASAYVEVPCDVVIGGHPEIDFTTPIEISANSITITSAHLFLRQPPKAGSDETIVLIEAERLNSHLARITTNGVKLTFSLQDSSNLTYPVIQYVHKKPTLPTDQRLHEKYRRLKRILMEFRSHSRGSLAKYREKIEHERVLRNDLGRRILNQLLKDGILRRDEKFYFLEPDAVNKFLGVSWMDLRRGLTDPKLIQYLQSIT